jgi:uncharacterized oligopeptide transporter (OPT) family protein
VAYDRVKPTYLKETHWFFHHVVQAHSTLMEYTNTRINRKVNKYIYIYIYICIYLYIGKSLIPKKIFKYYWNVLWKSKVKITQLTSLVAFFTNTACIPLTSLIGPSYTLLSTIEITILLYLRTILNIFRKGWKRYIEKKNVGTSNCLLVPPSIFLHYYKRYGYPHTTRIKNYKLQAMHCLFRNR